MAIYIAVLYSFNKAQVRAQTSIFLRRSRSVSNITNSSNIPAIHRTCPITYKLNLVTTANATLDTVSALL
jgi:hypothetical protein